MASIFRDLLKPGPNSIPQQLRALLQQSELYAQIAQGVGGGLSGKTPDGHAVQAALVIGDARPHASDRLLGSLDLMLTGHDDRASSTPGKAIAHPGLPYAAAIADCEAKWDRGTHMTRKEWSRTCRRVQERLKQLELR